MENISLLPTFIDKADSSQCIYRQVLKAMSEPASILEFDNTIASSGKHDDSVCYWTTWAIAQTLLDNDCKVWVSEELSQEVFTRSLSFYTDTVITSETNVADFAFLTINDLHRLAEFTIGELAQPHQSCTLLVQAPGLSDETQIIVSGPGIKAEKTAAIEGLQPEHIQQIQKNHRLYPCGVDIIFCAPQHIMALPRTSAVALHPSRLKETA